MKITRPLLPLALILLTSLACSAASPNLHYFFPPEKVVPREVETDICIYGGSSAGLSAAVTAARTGHRVLLLNPGRKLGGLSTGGLGHTDTGDKRGIGGFAKEFYLEVGKQYGTPDTMVMNFEPSVAEAAFEALWKPVPVPIEILHKEYLASVKKNGPTIFSITTLSGLTVRAKVFIDATYEGDLMALAGVSFTTGREGNAKYNETVNGAYISTNHQFLNPVDPYIVPGNPSSGLLPCIEPGPVPTRGEGDHRIQAYNFRMCFSKDPDNRVPFTTKPRNYDRSKYELLARYLATGFEDIFHKFDPIPNNKTDTNNHGALSTDYIGANYEWPTGSYETRERIFQDHIDWHKGLFYFLATDPAVPQKIRDHMNQYGLAKDEFTDTDNWPHQLYIREARRMVAEVVMTEHHCWGHESIEDSVGLASYGMDSHNTRRFVQDGRVLNEGNVQAHGFPAYKVSYRAIIPKRDECQNLLVPVCLSSSHIAYGSIRMEPVFMVLGQSAAIAADLAIKGEIPLQDIPYPTLEANLLKSGQILTPPPPRRPPSRKFE